MGFTDLITGLSFISMHVGLARLDKGLRQSIDIPKDKLQAYVDLTARSAQIITITNQIRQLKSKADKLKKDKLNAEHAQLMVQIGQLRLQHEQYKVEQKRLELELERERRKAQENQILRLFVDLYDQALTYFQQKRYLDFLVLCVAIIRIYRQIYSDLDDANNRLKLTELKENIFSKLSLVLENEQSRQLIADDYASAIKIPYSLWQDGESIITNMNQNLALASNLRNIAPDESWDAGLEKINICYQNLYQAKTESLTIENNARDFSGGIDVQEFFFLINNAGVSDIQSGFSNAWEKLLHDIEARVGASVVNIYSGFQPLPDQLHKQNEFVAKTLNNLESLRGSYKLGNSASQLKEILPVVEDRLSNLEDALRKLSVQSENTPKSVMSRFLELVTLQEAVKQDMLLFPAYVINQAKLSPKEFEKKVTSPFDALIGSQKDGLASQFGRLFSLYHKYLQLDRGLSKFRDSVRAFLYKIIKDDAAYSNIYQRLKENFDPGILHQIEADIDQLSPSAGDKIKGLLSSSKGKEYKKRKLLINRYTQVHSLTVVDETYPALKIEELPNLPNAGGVKSPLNGDRQRRSKKWLIAIPVGAIVTICLCFIIILAIPTPSTASRNTPVATHMAFAEKVENTDTPIFTETATELPTSTSTPSPTATFTPAPLNQVTVFSASINLRSGPGTEYKIVGSAKQGEILDIYGITENQSWLMIDRDGLAWVGMSVVKSELDPATIPLVTPVPTSTSTPTNTPTETAAPTATRTPKVNGIGVSRSKIQSVFSSLGFSFRSGTPVDGMSQTIGASEEGLALIQLIGPNTELVEASIVIFIPNDAPDKTLLNSAYMLGLTSVVLPNWNSSADWITTNVDKAVRSSRETYEASTRVDGIKVDLLVSKTLGAITVTFSR